MQIHKLTIAGLTLPHNLLLAPLAGYTNYPFRKMFLRAGAGLTFTEMVSAKGLSFGNRETKKLLCCGEETPKAAQLFGSSPALLRAACESEELAPFDLIDINMGCPVPKVVKNGEGSALLENLPLAEEIVRECAKSNKRISVKFRIGYNGKKFASEIAKRMEGAGACMLTVHGRLREKMYAGEPDYAQIAAAKNAVKIPVIANGGVFTAENARTMTERTGADGIMLARAALFDLNVFNDISGRENVPVLPALLTLIEEEAALFGEAFALVFCRKIAAFFTKGMKGAAELRRRFLSAESISRLRELCGEVFS